MRLHLLLNQECQRLWLTPGSRIACRHGMLWLTQEPHRPRGPSPDIVLGPDQRYEVLAAGHFFLSHLIGRPVACELMLTPRRRWWQALRRPVFGSAWPEVAVTSEPTETMGGCGVARPAHWAQQAASA